MITKGITGGKAGPGDAYRTVFDWLRQGQYAAGEKLPSERQLTDLFQINHQTIRRALRRLEDEGYIENRPRIGRFVRDVNSGRMVRQIALVLPNYLGNNHPAAAAWMQGMHNAFDAGTYSLSMMFFRPGLFEFDVVDVLIRRRVTGMLFLDNGVTPQSIRKLLDSGIHVVQIGAGSAELSAMTLPMFRFSEVRAVNAIVDGLVERGHRSILMFRYSADYEGHDLHHALEAATRRYAGTAEIRTVDIHNEAFSFDPAFIHRQLNEAAPFDAVVVPDELVAREVFREAYRQDWRIPDRFSLVATVNNAADLYPISLAHGLGFEESVRLVETASESMIARINGETVYANEVSLTADVKWAESVADRRRQRPTAARHPGKT